MKKRRTIYVGSEDSEMLWKYCITTGIIPFEE